MGDEQDSWFKPFGFDPGKFAEEKLKAAEAQVSALAQEGKAVVEKAETAVVQQVTTVVKKVQGAVEGGIKKVISVVPGAPAPSGSTGGGSGGGGSVSSLGGSVGAGGANNPDDVRAVQAALGIDADGKCGGGTIGAIKTFQKSIGMASPDGRIDVGGRTARALAGGGGGAGGGSAPSGANFLEGAAGLGGRIVDGVKDLLGGSDDASPNQSGRDGGADGGKDGGADGGKDGGVDGGTDSGADGGAPDAGAEETPVFNPTSPVPHDVKADTLEDFVNSANAGRGPAGSAGHMQPKFNFSPTEDPKGRVTRVNMVCETSIVRPRFAGGRPSPEQRALIKQAEQLIKEHEERHRDIAKDFASRAIKAMRGKPRKQADEEFKKTMKAMDDAQKNMDLREGMLIVEFNGPNGRAGPSTGVRLGPAPP
jgi:hypothetical protein